MRPRSPVVVTALLAALTAVPPVTINLYLPSLPSMVADLGTTVAMVQLTVTSFFFAFAAGQLLYGPLSDRFGRRPLLVGALVVYLVGGIGCSLAPTVELLVAARLVQAIGACGAPVLARAVVVDLYGREQAARVLAYIGAAMGIVPAFGPWLGGIIETHLGWRASFWLMVVLSVLLLVGTLLLLHESNRRSDRYALGPARMLRNYGDLLRQRVFVGYAATLGCMFAGVYSYMTASPHVFLGVLHLSPETFGSFFLATAAAWTVSSYVTGRITQRVGIDRMLAYGTALGAAAGLTLAGFIFCGIVTVPTILGPMMVYAYAMGIIIHNSMAGAVGPYREMAGAASALLGFVQMTTAACATFVVGLFYDGTAIPMAIGVGGLSLAGAVIFRLTIWRHRDWAAA
ncbi:DHA1 family bicyclomycin/chloramphenicol resistance-like MFS transporter [Constrictibacter sp. MBR-5]|jgi:DHA1 family bicyclomycin/chloramphenicol resistance-like MFS transporter|uniref:multidrug effflux MFS transporter n=1 Tax=Constrictibacter sp. MBR-5 TaxID=3156467 RepID=UPI0033953C30